MRLSVFAKASRNVMGAPCRSWAHFPEMVQKVIALSLVAVLALQLLASTAAAQPPPTGAPVEGTRARVQTLLASRSTAEVTFQDGTRVRGQIVAADDTSFTIREERTRRESTWQYFDVTSIDTIAWNRRKTAITLAIVGSVLAVLCFAPFPVGFLCHDDPS